MSEQVSTEKTSFLSEGGICSCIPARYIVGCMCFIGIVLQYAMKVLLSVAIVVMVKTPVITAGSNSSKEQDVCPGKEIASSSENQEGEFDWFDMEGFILSSYYYGYVTTQLLAGRLSEIFGSKTVLGSGLFVAGLMTVIGPLAARTHVAFFVTARIVVGAASGLIIPAVNNMLPKWFVPEERAFIGGTIMSGIPLGIVVSMILSGVLGNAGGWPLVFYFFGGVTILFIFPWYFLAFDFPDTHPRITETEKIYILNGNGKGNEESDEIKRSYPVPWFAILRSLPMWVHVIMGMGYSWVSFTLLTELPSYLSQILHYELQESGLISSLPYISSGIFTILSSYISQKLRQNDYISQLTIYRILNTISGYGSGLCLLLVTFSGCDNILIVALLICALGTASCYVGGSFLNHIDLGKNFTGTLAGIYLTMYNVMGVVTPAVIGAIVNQPTLSQWKIVFYIGAAIPAACSTLYLIFGSTEEQYWNKLPSDTEQSSDDCSKQVAAA